MLSSESINQSELFDECHFAIKKLIDKIKPQTSTSIYSCIIGLFIGYEQFQYTNQICFMSIDMDRKIKNYVLRFYDMEKIEIVVECELYYGFVEKVRPVIGNQLDRQNNELKLKQQVFYQFPYKNDITFGILFKDSSDAQSTINKLKSISPKQAQLQQLRNKRINKIQKQQYQKTVLYQIQSTYHKFISLLKNAYQGRDQYQDDKVEDDDEKQESKIISVRKYGQLSYDENSGGFRGEDLEPELKAMLVGIGIINISQSEKKD